MSHTTWECNGLAVELDLEDYDDNKRYLEAFKEMDKEEKAIRKDDVSHEVIKAYCDMFYHLFDRLFGAGTGNKLFGGKYNARVCDEVYTDFLRFVEAQKEASSQRKLAFAKKYTPKNRARRRSNT